jgi:hypothetical protein
LLHEKNESRRNSAEAPAQSDGDERGHSRHVSNFVKDRA